MNQSALDPHGPVAQSIMGMTWTLFIVCAVVYALTMAAFWWALARRRRAEDDGPASERRLTRVVTALTIATAMTLVALVVASEVNGRQLEPPRRADGVVIVDVTGHQWWWDFTYYSESPTQRVTSPNELHIPVGVPVVIRARAQDVIHSFWVPNLSGKRDLIPGQVTSTWLQADTPGVYRGQCAEFCGYQHAKMAFLVVAEPMDRFQAWLRQQRTPAREPALASEQRGLEVVLSRQCVLCHRIEGTPAGSHVGPDLTHIGSRRTLAAGALPNTDATLDQWIDDPQAIKPGSRMPSHMLEASDRHAVVAYLRSLQ
jgi:cytochrome c oxidase subunit 2